MRYARFDFVGRLDGRTPLGDGSVQFTARLTRTGVFDYGDHSEYRPADEVFKADALNSFKNLTVTEGHQAFVDASNWRSISIGHVGEDVRRDGDFVVASVVIKDANALKKIDAQDPAQRLVEISMGYTVTLEDTAGVTDTGEKFDSIQRDIVGNHAALGPVGWGRAGKNVRLLDGTYANGMADNIAPVPVARIDAPSANEQIQKDLDAARSDGESLRKDRDEARADASSEKARADKLEAERDAARKDAAEALAQVDAARADAEKAIDARVALIDAARGILGKDFSFSGKDDKAVRLAVLAKVDSKANFDGKSDDYVTARFDLAIESVHTDRASLSQVQEAVSTPAAVEKSRLDEAHEKAAADARELAKGGPPAGAVTRK